MTHNHRRGGGCFLHTSLKLCPSPNTGGTEHMQQVLPLFGLGKLSCRWKTTFSTKCWMLLWSGPRTNTIQSWVKPSTVGFFLTWARWPSSSFTWTAPYKTKKCRSNSGKAGKTDRQFTLQNTTFTQHRIQHYVIIWTFNLTVLHT